MKKTFLFVVLALMLTFGGSFAQKTEEAVQNCQWIGLEPYCSFEIKENKEYSIPNWGVIKVADFVQSDRIWNSKGYRSADYDDTTQADSVVLTIHITNTTLTTKDLLENVSVKVIYNNQYVIDGWWHQLKEKYDSYDKKIFYDYVYESNRMAIEPFYQGHYRFGVSVPDYIVNDRKPLYMEITLDNMSMTYIIRR